MQASIYPRSDFRYVALSWEISEYSLTHIVLESKLYVQSVTYKYAFIRQEVVTWRISTYFSRYMQNTFSYMRIVKKMYCLWMIVVEINDTRVSVFRKKDLSILTPVQRNAGLFFTCNQLHFIFAIFDLQVKVLPVKDIRGGHTLTVCISI